MNPFEYDKWLPDKSFPKRIGPITQTKPKIHRGGRYAPHCSNRPVLKGLILNLIVEEINLCYFSVSSKRLFSAPSKEDTLRQRLKLHRTTFHITRRSKRLILIGQNWDAENIVMKPLVSYFFHVFLSPLKHGVTDAFEIVGIKGSKGIPWQSPNYLVSLPLTLACNLQLCGRYHSML